MLWPSVPLKGRKWRSPRTLGEEGVEPETEKESPSFDDLLSGGGDALAAFTNKCSNLLLLPSPVFLSHLQFLLGLSALAVGVAVYFFAF